MTFIQPQPDGTYDLMVDQNILCTTISVVHSRYRTERKGSETSWLASLTRKMPTTKKKANPFEVGLLLV